MEPAFCALNCGTGVLGFFCVVVKLKRERERAGFVMLDSGIRIMVPTCTDKVQSWKVDDKMRKWFTFVEESPVALSVSQ